MSTMAAPDLLDERRMLRPVGLGSPQRPNPVLREACPELLSTKFLLWRAEVGGISCGISEQLLDIGIARGAYRGGEEPAALSELIAVRLRDLADDAMGA